jgi:hypothetical protein
MFMRARFMRLPIWLIPSLVLAAAPPLGAASHAAGGGGSCGDGLFTVGETCDACPADCTPKACAADAKAHRRYSIAVAWPTGPGPTDVTALVSYRSGTLSMPGSASDKTVESRIKPLVKPDMLLVRDSDYALALTLGMTKGLPNGSLLEIDFDACAGGKAPSAADVTCEVVACVGAGGPLAGCSCQVTAL